MSFSLIKTKLDNDLAKHYQDRLDLRNAQFLLKILVASLLMNVGVTIALILFSENGLLSSLATISTILGALISLNLLLRGNLKAASIFYLLQGWSACVLVSFFIGDSTAIVFPVFLILLFGAVVLLNKRQSIFFVALTILTTLVIYLLSITGNMPQPLYSVTRDESHISQLGITIISFTIFWYLRNTLVDITAQAEKNEASAVQSNLKLQKEIEIRKQAEAELEHERVSLVEKVKAQTAELRDANNLLEDASKRKDAFLATMSHELRTPLNVVITGSQAMQMGIYGKLNNKQTEKLLGIQSSGQHLLSLINDILDVSKIAAGEEKITLQSVNLIEICKESASLVENLAKKGGLNLTVDLDESVTQVLGDRRRLKQILTNLLSNSIKFTPKGGKIGISLMGYSAEKMLTLTIWDTGIGIPKENFSSLFEPFIQVDSSLSRKHNGTGIGLSLVKQLSEMHGGSVRVESEVNEGSKFIVTLPWEPEIVSKHEDAIQTVDSTISF